MSCYIRSLRLRGASPPPSLSPSPPCRSGSRISFTPQRILFSRSSSLLSSSCQPSCKPFVQHRVLRPRVQSLVLRLSYFALLYGFSSARKVVETFIGLNPQRERELGRERERPISCWSLYLISSREIDFSHSLPFLLAAQASQSITRNSSSSPESQKNSYKCTWL